jgi:hypothetical protein
VLGSVMGRASAASQVTAVLCLMLLAGGCASNASGSGTRDLAGAYLAIATPANRQLDQEVDSYGDHARGDLGAAESALRAEAATERRFDQLLLRIKFPTRIDATARALVTVNQHRIALTELQAQSASTAGLRSFTSSHRSADAAVEAQVRIIRRQLGLPPPASS